MEPENEENNNCTKCMKDNIYIKLYIILFTIMWVVALVLLIQSFKVLELWAQVLGIVGMLPVTPFGPLLTLAVVLLGRKKA